MDSIVSLKSYLWSNKVTIDNGVFRLHYGLTTLILLTSATIVTIQLFGNPIDCSVDKAFDDLHKDVMNTFCWIQSTFTIPHSLSDDKIAFAKAHPGVRTQVGPEDKIQHHKYYQWVVFALVFQAVLFYLPYYLWTVIEGGRVEMMIMNLNKPNLKFYEKRERIRETDESGQTRNQPENDSEQVQEYVPDYEVRTWEEKALVDYFVNSMADNQVYLIGFVICEVLNFVNVICQIFFTDMFLDYEFTKYGTQVLEFVETDYGARTDPMDRIFPKVTKCTFNKYGPSGSVINFDGICVLPLNIVNEKVYVFLWFWFIILAVISGVALIYRMIVIFAAPCRLVLLRNCVTLLTNENQNREDEEEKKHRQVASINARCTTGDWFLLYQLGKNVNSVIFRDVITDLAGKIVKRRNLRE